ncbi:Pentatricopeptide repeat-containing protein, partial [Durusdinium trenchii]
VLQVALLPDIASYGTCLSAVCKRPLLQWPTALVLLVTAQQCRLEPNIISHNTAMTAALAMEVWTGSLAILQKALLGALEPSTITSNNAMASDLATGHWQQALERFAPRRRSDAATVGITVACYAQSVLWAQGLQALVASAMAGTEVSGIAINAGIGRGC